MLIKDNQSPNYQRPNLKKKSEDRATKRCVFRCHANEEDESQDINTVFVRFGFQTDTAKCIFF